ncbi:molecular chaperone GrpE [Ruminococcaceae bacterium KH2T8]|nr:molecular chaperone GrpE [Ruminococcaceae bacterium KH2T8]
MSDNEELEFPNSEDTNDIEEIVFDVEDTDAEAEDQNVKAEEAETEADEAEASEEEAEGDADDKTAELEKRYMALFAEYENFRKRTTKEKEDLYASAVANVTKDWLGVLDNIDRALDAGKNADENSVEKVIQGIELIGKQAADVLSKLGVEEIECERGTKFDPNLHEAVMHVDDDDLGEQEIAAVFQKGYIYKDRVVRHAVVQVAN